MTISPNSYITAGFNENDLLLSATAIQGMPLEPDCPAVGNSPPSQRHSPYTIPPPPNPSSDTTTPLPVSVNGSPAIQFGFDAATTKAFAQVVRQAFSNVVSVYTDYANGTTLMDADVTLGLLGVLDLPVSAHVPVPAQFNLTSCLLSELRADVYVPSKIGGNPVDTPELPAIPGLDKLPGVRELLKVLLGESLEK